jgi:lipopolysaccharide biosynthesis regulator YciM
MGNATLLAIFLGGFVLFAVGLAIGRSMGEESRKRAYPGDASLLLPEVLQLLHSLVDDDQEGALEKATDIARSQDLPARLHLVIGDLYRQKGEFNKAIRIRQSLAIRTDLTIPEREEVQFHLGYDYYKAGFMAKAAALLDPLTKSKRYRELAIPLLEEIAFLTEDYESALRWSREKGATASGLKVRQALFLSFEALRLIDAGDFENAVGKARAALKVNPDTSSAYLFWGDALFKSGKEELALEVWRDGLGHHPELVPLMIDRLERAFQDVKEPWGLPELLSLIVSREDCPRPVRLFVAEFLLSRGGYPEAASILESFLGSHPESLEGWANLAAIHLHQEKRDAALQDLSRLITLIGTSSPLYVCTSCGYSTGQHRWRCPQCRGWETLRLEGS